MGRALRGDMTLKLRVGMLVLLCLAFVGAAIGLRGQALPPPEPQRSDERIISGSDLGFLVEGQRGRGQSRTVTGTLMVRINGEWIPANAPGSVPLTSR